MQTFITIGIFGFLTIVAIFILPSGGTLRSESYLYLIFIFIFSFNNPAESMLKTKAGVVSYAFVNIFFNQSSIIPVNRFAAALKITIPVVEDE